jgi:hypothetical protein
VSDFLSVGVGEKVGRTEETYVQIYAPFGSGQYNNLQRQAVHSPRLKFLYRSDSCGWNSMFVAQVSSKSCCSHGIVAISMLEKIVAITTIASLCLLAILLNVTSPTTVGPFGLLIVFILGYMSSLGVVAYFIYIVSRVIAHTSSAFTVKKPVAPMTFRIAYYYSTVIAAAPIMLIGLQSVGAIGFYEVVLVLLFAVIGCVYITKRIH